MFFVHTHLTKNGRIIIFLKLELTAPQAPENHTLKRGAVGCVCPGDAPSSSTAKRALLESARAKTWASGRRIPDGSGQPRVFSTLSQGGIRNRTSIFLTK